MLNLVNQIIQNKNPSVSLLKYLYAMKKSNVANSDALQYILEQMSILKYKQEMPPSNKTRFLTDKCNKGI